jgi:DNA polymerase-3 subunit gamma/tau
VRDGLSLLDQAIGQSGAADVRAEAVRDMLGLADRAMIIDLMEALMGGDIAAALGIMDRAHELGADPLVILQDLAELCHLLTRFRAAPALRQDGSLPEAERVRGAALAQRLSVPVLGRTWQMLLKGIGELQLEGADRRAAAEMVLIRIAHVADMPTPGDLVKRLMEAGEIGSAPRPAPGGGGGGLRAVAGGAPIRAEAAPSAPATALAQPSTWQEIVALASGVKPLLHAQLRHGVRPIRIAPGRLEINPEPDAPRDLAAQLTALLTEATGQRWTVIISQEAGAPTLAAQGKEAEADRLASARAHPLVQAILAAFPGATIEAVHDGAADAYGLSRGAAMADDDARDFAPPDAEPAYGDDESLPDDF